MNESIPRNTWGANELHIPFGRLDIRNFSIGILDAKDWNSLPNIVKQSRSPGVLRNTLHDNLFSSENEQ